jgi:catechol 2,3-dioxygenase-like lactoylglutathione lyase family enzyme
MNFVSIRIITADLKRLARFYEEITGIAVKMYTEDFGELTTPSCTLALGSTRTLALFGGDVARPADNHTAIVELQVGDVDAEYLKLTDVIGDAIVQKPTTMPWGNRSLLFRDPDGNLVNFFTPVTAEAIKKFAKRPTEGPAMVEVTHASAVRHH